MQNQPNIVALPDNDIAHAGSNINGEVTVAHGDRTFGAGPWIFRAEQLRPATDAERDAYLARCRPSWL